MPTRPTPVTAAVVLLWIGAIIAAILGVVFLIAVGNESELVKTAASKGIDQSTLKGSLTGLAIGCFIAAVINVIFALRIGKGGRVARLVFTIIAVLSIVGNLMTGLQSGQSLHWIALLIQLVILILLWVPKASQDFFNGSAA